MSELVRRRLTIEHSTRSLGTLPLVSLTVLLGLLAATAATADPPYPGSDGGSS